MRVCITTTIRATAAPTEHKDARRDARSPLDRNAEARPGRVGRDAKPPTLAETVQPLTPVHPDGGFRPLVPRILRLPGGAMGATASVETAPLPLTGSRALVSASADAECPSGHRPPWPRERRSGHLGARWTTASPTGAILMPSRPWRLRLSSIRDCRPGQAGRVATRVWPNDDAREVKAPALATPRGARRKRARGCSTRVG
jgi:hypothetical protein